MTSTIKSLLASKSTAVIATALVAISATSGAFILYNKTQNDSKADDKVALVTPTPQPTLIITPTTSQTPTLTPITTSTSKTTPTVIPTISPTKTYIDNILGISFQYSTTDNLVITRKDLGTIGGFYNGSELHIKYSTVDFVISQFTDGTRGANGTPVKQLTMLNGTQLTRFVGTDNNYIYAPTNEKDYIVPADQYGYFFLPVSTTIYHLLATVTTTNQQALSVFDKLIVTVKAI